MRSRSGSLSVGACTAVPAPRGRVLRMTETLLQRPADDTDLGVRRRAKIVCTIGRATASPERITGLVAAGMDVARFNFSHGDHALHAEAYGDVRAASDAAGRAV